MKELLIKFYLDYLNDWLTVEAYASYNQLSASDTLALLTIGRGLAYETL